MKHTWIGRKTPFAAMVALGSAATMATAQTKLPVYEVTSPLMSSAAATAINKQLGAKGLLDARSVFSIDNRNSIQLVPQKLMGGTPKEDEDSGQRADLAIDMAGFKALKPWPRESAATTTSKALSAGGLVLPGAASILGESQLSIRDKSGKELATRGLETIVSYKMSLDSIPISGPGYKVRFAYAPSGALTQAYIFGWNVKKGATVDLISSTEAMQKVQDTLGSGKAKLSAKLVYYAPPADFQPKYIFPHYEVSGTMQVGEQVVELRKTFVPAQKGGLSVSISTQTSGDIVYAQPAIKGGRAPYRLQWSSATTDLVKAGNGENSIQYQVNPRRGMDPVQETLRLIVTDSDGVQIIAKTQPAILSLAGIPASYFLANITSKPAATPYKRQPGRYDGAIEWIDWANNADNCYDEMIARGLPVQFYWGEMNAWEQDYKKESAGGDDSSWVDDVDITFYTGHANGDGFVFRSSVDDTFLHYNDASWGEREAEWLIIAACGPLQLSSGGQSLWRWLPAFQGLHILMGYGNVSYDSSQEGSKFMHRILRNSSPMRIRDAWISTASEEQSSDVLMGLMGPVRDDGVWNWDDYFWGKGTVGPDIPASRITGYWYYVVPC